jgi:hypothetical protein
MMHQERKWFVGIDWASQEHVVSLCDAQGTIGLSLKWVDAVEKVAGTLTTRNNRITQARCLDRSCAPDDRFESILRRPPPQNPFSTTSVNSRQSKYLFSTFFEGTTFIYAVFGKAE